MPPASEGMGSGSLDAAVLRIFTPSGSPAGLGFLVTGRLALTCAHVVTTALGIEDGAQPPVGATIGADLPLLRPGQADADATASVEHWIPAQPSGAGDVAVLRLSAPLPGARPVRLVEADRVWGHPARAYGLPDGRPGGVWHSGTLRHRQANGWVQADLAGDGYRVSPGFSGSPVWDDELAGVVGMMAVAESGQPPVSYLIPTSGLLAAWPGLRELVLPPSPFRGLRPFMETDTALFHGRQAESEQVARIVAGERWTTLVGPSGCGKSSLAMAGVIPRRRGAGDCSVTMRPGHHASPLHALAAELLPLLDPELSETQWLAETSVLAGVLAEQGLRGIVPRILERHRHDRLLVVVDQFEELLDLPPAAVDELVRVLFDDNTPAAVKVLCTLRADFLEPMLAHPRLGPFVSKRVCALEPMRPEQLREIITRPVDEIPGVRYQPNLAERILADTGTEPGALPLLGFTLDLLWERQDRGVLTHHAYTNIGGVAGALGKYAEGAWAENIPAQDEVAAERLLTQLVRVPIGAAAATRRIAPRAELEQQEWRIAQRLAATRLLVLKGVPAGLGTGGDGPETVELAHEALITGWDRLACQVTANRSFLDWRESLRHDLDRWQRGERAPDLLPTQTALAVARQWLPTHAADLSAAERDYLDRGHIHRRAQTRKRKALFSGLGILFVAAAVFFSLLVYARQQSSEREALANSRALAQVSQDMSATDPALSVMTALAGYRTSPTQEARNQLLRQYMAHSDSARVLSGLPGKIATAHTSRDGNVVLASTNLGRAMLFVHATTGTVRSEPVPAKYVIYTMVSPDGKRAGFVNEDGTAGWFDVNAADADRPAGPVHTLPKVTGLGAYLNHRADSAAMSADGKLIAVPASDHPEGTPGERKIDRLVWWDTATGTIGSVPAPPNTSNGLWISPDNRTLLVQTSEEALTTGLVAVDMATGQTRTVVAPKPDQFLRMSGDRTAVAVCHLLQANRSVVQRVRISDGAAEGRPYSGSAFNCLLQAADATGRRILVRDDSLLALLDLDQGTKISAGIQKSQPKDLGSLLFPYVPELISAGGKLLLAGHSDAQITYIELLTDTEPPPRSQTLTVTEQVLTNDASKTISLLQDGSLQLRPAAADSDRVLAEAPPPNPPSNSANHLALSGDGGLVATRDAANVVTVRDTTTLRQTTRITTPMPPSPPPTTASDFILTGRKQSPDNNFTYFFDGTGHLVTVSGTQVQQWDTRTGQQLAHFDTRVLHPGRDGAPATWRPQVGPYPAANQIGVIIPGDPAVRVVDLTTGRTATTVDTTATDLIGIQFDSSGRYLALLRQASIVELWQRDPPRRELGPLHSLSQPWYASFLDGNGRYIIAANNSIRIYQIGQQAPVDSYEFGPPDGSRQQSPYSFINVSRDGRTVIYAAENGIGGTLTLDPAAWERDLCRIIGHRQFTPDERASLPVRTLAQQVCPG
ncbi:MAG TPA: trypsin-like peptidase domain-containing protein [Pseudonocardiaceae bacterium]|nr:trypsin-like peptidase domain-containing protein [Pseudonocardiaceae bacterium]